MKKINYLLYSLLGFCLLGFLFLITVFFLSSIEKISTRNIKAEIQKFKENEIEFLILKKAYREWQRADQTYTLFRNDFLFRFNEFSEFRSNFESLLVKNFLDASQLSYNIENLDRDNVKVSIGFQTVGPYKNLKRFIFDIEQQSRIAFVKDIQMTRFKDGVQAKFALEVYFVR
jgi:Tfp pilus assembly protein PilO